LLKTDDIGKDLLRVVLVSAHLFVRLLWLGCLVWGMIRHPSIEISQRARVSLDPHFMNVCLQRALQLMRHSSAVYRPQTKTLLVTYCRSDFILSLRLWHFFVDKIGLSVPFRRVSENLVNFPSSFLTDAIAIEVESGN
jgi:hypothetical protein